MSARAHARPACNRLAWAVRARQGRLTGNNVAVRAAASLVPSPPQSTTAGSLGQSLIDWVVSRGGYVADGVYVEELRWGDEVGFGLATDRDLPMDACLLSLPERCQLTTCAPGADPAVVSLVQRVESRVLDLPGMSQREARVAKLALQLLTHCQCGEGSPFHAYLRLLPTRVPGLPIFFGSEALQALQYKPMIQTVMERQHCYAVVQANLAAALNLAGPDDVLAAERQQQRGHCGSKEVASQLLGAGYDLEWAWRIASTRALQLRGPTGLPYAAMLPLVDMANHSNDSPAFQPRRREGGVHLVSMRHIAAGDPLVFSYGDRCSDALLLEHGFLIEGNAHEALRQAGGSLQDLLQSAASAAAAVPRDSSASSSSNSNFYEHPDHHHIQEQQQQQPSDWQLAALDRLGLQTTGGWEAHDTSVGRSLLAAPLLLAAARVLAATCESQVAGADASTLGCDQGGGLPWAEESAAWAMLQQVVRRRASELGSSIAEDEALLPPLLLLVASANGGNGSGGGDVSAATIYYDDSSPSTPSSSSPGVPAGTAASASTTAADASASSSTAAADAADVHLAVRYRLEKKRLLGEADLEMGRRAAAAAAKASGRSSVGGSAPAWTSSRGDPAAPGGW